ncbi:unnamed protein product [Arctia plantaginis]|uniref:DNA repair protein REV1 n=1 Tax=Arctia plantaginis TaxID=874455 RepID=A0A8S1ANE8_ARCPL|nr:unnamed protein product [Arctia plantaginis]
MRRNEDKFPDNGFEAWGGYMHAKISKLEEQFSARAGTEETLSNIFNGVSIYVNGFTVPSADELKVLMSKHGGVYHVYQRSDDYIIASNLPDTKVKNMNLAKVVKPQWIVESLAANRLLDYRDYLLYGTSRTQKQINFRKIIKENDSLANDIKFNDTKQEQDLSEIHKTINEPNTTTSDQKPSKERLDNATSLDCQEILKQNLGAVTKTAADPEFIAEFYKNSRLHHISQLGACFKQHINELRENSNFQFPAREQLKEIILASNNFKNLSQLKFEKNKIIMHIDMDCFFVSVGLRNRPDLKGKPVAVTHSKGGQGRSKRPGVDRDTEFNLYKQNKAKKLGITTGISHDEIKIENRVDDIDEEDSKYGSMSEIASCSYEARAKGLSNGMFMGSALRLCPDLQTIPYDFDGYKEVAYTLYNTIAQYSLDIEAVSCDEMYLDCTELLSDMNVNVQGFATILREEIKAKTGCPCSTGFGGNRLQARLATKKAKPDGQFFLTEDLVEDFMYDIKLRDLPGVGSQTAYKLESLGHITCGSLQTLTLASLKSHLGNKTGAQLFEQCRGRDPNPLTFHTVRKSVSAEVNYGIRFENNYQCLEFLKQLSAEVHSRMHQFKAMGKCITLKLMVRAKDAPVETAKFLGHGYCDVINKSVSLQTATNDLEVITKEVILLCKKQNIDPTEMRGIGIQVTKLDYVTSRPTVGAINKFLFNNKIPKAKIKSEIKAELVETDQRNNPTTPTKSKVSTSPKKSPIISIKSPTIRKRGRPSKSLRQPSNNLMNKFLQGQNVGRDVPYKDPMIRAVVKEEVERKVEQSQTPRGLLGLPWNKVRALLRAWLDSGETPLQCDVVMIIDYLQEMVINKNIEKLQVLMNFLRRTTRDTGSVAWLEVYNRISEEVQNAMVAVYGKKLYISN